ncbi:MAG TPA: DUF3108 domain-containing protein [Acetobacteraceae bacterium]|nr:DUF3108 domain-containing protein [Acetobacteraceae bacterium]
MRVKLFLRSLAVLAVAGFGACPGLAQPQDGVQPQDAPQAQGAGLGTAQGAVPGAAQAQGAAQAPGPLELNYTGYAHAMVVLRLQAEADLKPQSYRLRVSYHTAGLLGFLAPSRMETTVQGLFEGMHANPLRFYSAGNLRGATRVTWIDYLRGMPEIRRLLPPADGERDPVPPSAMLHTLDTLSAMAELMRQVERTGDCDGEASTFDGRRLAWLHAHTSGREVLPQTDRSTFSGPALRCDFEGRQLAGFKLDEDRDRQARLQHGVAWLGAAGPGGRLVPVRIDFEHNAIGQTTLYLDQSGD